jgi:biopolymer transport protein ExbB/TolQ
MLSLFGDCHHLLFAISVGQVIEGLFKNMSAAIMLMGDLCYLGLIGAAAWGLFSAAMVWLRINHTRFRSENAQETFLKELDQRMVGGDFSAAADLCEGDRRAVPQLVLLAISLRDLGYGKVRQMVAERFQRDFLAAIDYRMSWVNTMIKSAPMLGLLGTVLGMMGAFAKLATAKQVDPSGLANDISLALITTCMGLFIAIPLILMANSITVRVRKMEDSVGAGLGQFFESFKTAMEKR